MLLKALRWIHQSIYQSINRYRRHNVLNLVFKIHHYDVTRTLWSLESPATPLLVQQLVQVSNKENIASALLSLCEGNPPVTGRFHSLMDSDSESVPTSWKCYDRQFRHCMGPYRYVCLLSQFMWERHYPCAKVAASYIFLSPRAFFRVWICLLLAYCH